MIDQRDYISCGGTHRNSGTLWSERTIIVCIRNGGGKEGKGQEDGIDYIRSARIKMVLMFVTMRDTTPTKYSRQVRRHVDMLDRVFRTKRTKMSRHVGCSIILQ
jgi:hypothetical protein